MAMRWVLVVSLFMVIQCYACKFDAGLFQFGDSLSDTGNAVAAFPLETIRAQTPPYGRTFFKHPANRYSDGRLMIDHIAQFFKLPLLSPYLQSLGVDFKHGVDFAVAGATALNNTFLATLGIFAPVPFYLGRQVEWYLRFKFLVAEGADGRSPPLYAFETGLHVVGEIGGNDYTFAALSGFSNISSLVPLVVGSIAMAIKTLYDSGARNFLVVNIPPEGCTPLYLTLFGTLFPLRDQYGCLEFYNSIDVYHNLLLKAEIEKLKEVLHDAYIVYADLFGIYTEVLNNPLKYGITNTLSACCGAGGPYNYNPEVPCGTSAFINGTLIKAESCPDPSKYIYWDELHFTDHFNEILAKGVLAQSALEITEEES